MRSGTQWPRIHRGQRYRSTLPIMGWTTTAMLDRYKSWMENEKEEALEAFRELRP